jgi:hypothetical protein
MTKSRSLRATALLALLGPASAFSAAYVGSAYEGFNYTAATITSGTASTYNGGTGWNATGDGSANTTNWGTGTSLTVTGTPSIQSSSLDYSGGSYPTELGNSILVSGVSAASNVGRAFGQSVDSGTFYFSYLVKKTVDNVRTVNFSFFGTNERIAIGQIASNVNLKLADGTADPDAATKANKGEFAVLVSNVQSSTGTAGVYTASSPVSFALNSTFLVVGKIEFNVSTVADRLTLYINPGNLSDESSSTAYMQVSGIDFGTLTGFRIFAGANATNFPASAAQFDEVRLGTTYNAVTGVLPIPEPSSFAALAGLAGLALAASRRLRA